MASEGDAPPTPTIDVTFRRSLRREPVSSALGTARPAAFLTRVGVVRGSGVRGPESRFQPLLEPGDRGNIWPALAREHRGKSDVAHSGLLGGRAERSPTNGATEPEYKESGGFCGGVRARLVRPGTGEVGGASACGANHGATVSSDDCSSGSDSREGSASVRNYEHTASPPESEVPPLARSRHPSRTTAIPGGDWEKIAPFVETVVAEVVKHSKYAEVEITRSLGRLAYWCWVGGLPLERQVVFDLNVIATWVSVGMSDVTKPTRRNYRSIAMHARRVLSPPAERDPYVPTLAMPVGSEPFSQAEQATLRSWAMSQGTAYGRHNALCLLALGLGAGLQGREIREVRREDVTVDDGGVLVAVRSDSAPRHVPVLAAWEDELTMLADNVAPDSWIFRPDREKSRVNSITIFVDASSSVTVRPNTRRMRSTWIVEHLTWGVPLAALVKAAGVSSVEAFRRLLPYVPEPSDRQLREALRGHDREVRRARYAADPEPILAKNRAYYARRKAKDGER